MVEPATVSDIIGETLVWDNHACLPLRPYDQSFIPELERFRSAGIDVVTINVACGDQPFSAATAMLVALREWVLDHADRFALVEAASDLAALRTTDRLGVCFDVEGMDVLEGDLDHVDRLYALGVRWMLATYNTRNAAGSGCLVDDGGLTVFGRAAVARMNDVGMVVCASHCGYRTAAELLDASRTPVIFSHSNPRGVFDHPRNIPDDLMRQCAASGGVIGINGFGPFLGAGADLGEIFADHTEYALDLIGDDHVALGTDYVFDRSELDAWLLSEPDTFPPELYPQGARMVTPSDLPRIAQILRERGLSVGSLRKVFGDNLVRIASKIWN